MYKSRAGGLWVCVKRTPPVSPKWVHRKFLEGPTMCGGLLLHAVTLLVEQACTLLALYWAIQFLLPGEDQSSYFFDQTMQLLHFAASLLVFCVAAIRGWHLFPWKAHKDQQQLDKAHTSGTLTTVRPVIWNLLCVGGEKRAQYTLFPHTQFPQDFWECLKSALLH